MPDSAAFTLDTAPGGGPCATTMAGRPFGPGFVATTLSHKAGAYSPLVVHVERPDGQQELKQIGLRLPPGVTAKLAGVDYYFTENDSPKPDGVSSACDSYANLRKIRY